MITRAALHCGAFTRRERPSGLTTQHDFLNSLSPNIQSGISALYSLAKSMHANLLDVPKELVTKSI